jgi:hypothetical protein
MSSQSGAEISSRRSWVRVVLHKGRGNLSGNVDDAHDGACLFDVLQSAYQYDMYLECNPRSVQILVVN